MEVNERHKVQLFLKDIIGIRSDEGAGIVILTDYEEKKSLNFFCDSAARQQLELRNKPLSQRFGMLPEVLLDLMPDSVNINHYTLLVYDLVAGEYAVKLISPDNTVKRRIRLCDAVLLMRLTGIPLYIMKFLFDRQGVPYSKERTRAAMPLNSLPYDRLKSELEKAVGEEDYRKASLLQHEINERKRLLHLDDDGQPDGENTTDDGSHPGD